MCLLICHAALMALGISLFILQLTAVVSLQSLKGWVELKNLSSFSSLVEGKWRTRRGGMGRGGECWEGLEIPIWQDFLKPKATGFREFTGYFSA